MGLFWASLGCSGCELCQVEGAVQRGYVFGVRVVSVGSLVA